MTPCRGNSSSIDKACSTILMKWLTRYRIKEFFRTSNWMSPLLSLGFALILVPLSRILEQKTQWTLFHFDPEGARSILGALSGAMLTFILFLYTMLLLAVQIASAQLTPRVITGVFGRRSTRLAAGIFIFSFIYCVAILGRIREPVPQLPVFLAIAFCLFSIMIFLYFVDFTAKSLRPISVMARISHIGQQVIEEVYPLVWEGPSPPPPPAQLPKDKTPSRFAFPGKSGVLLALDTEFLKKLAVRHDGLIELVPRVGESISRGDTLFNLFEGASKIPPKKLMASVFIGSERTIAQDPAFAFRMIVDISIRALSPAINDPTTAVLGLDQIQQLLLQVGNRRLRDEGIYDEAGKLRLLVPTPNWEDFVRLGIREIRWYGADSFQINRRLKAMLEDLMKRLPKERLAALEAELKLLNISVEKQFLEREDRELAAEPDFQGFGGMAHH